MVEKTLVLLSGGLDSSVLASWLACERQAECVGLFVDWGQSAARREKAAAERVANRLNIRLDMIDVSDWRRGFRERFKDMLRIPRNAVLIHLALPYALAGDCSTIVVGSTPEDATVVDSNQAFFSSLNRFWKDLDQTITVAAPFLDFALSKVDIIRWSDNHLGTDFIDGTSTCWKATPCIETKADWCPACMKRDLALNAART